MEERSQSEGGLPAPSGMQDRGDRVWALARALTEATDLGGTVLISAQDAQDPAQSPRMARLELDDLPHGLTAVRTVASGPYDMGASRFLHREGPAGEADRERALVEAGWTVHGDATATFMIKVTDLEAVGGLVDEIANAFSVNARPTGPWVIERVRDVPGWDGPPADEAWIDAPTSADLRARIVEVADAPSGRIVVRGVAEAMSLAYVTAHREGDRIAVVSTLAASASSGPPRQTWNLGGDGSGADAVFEWLTRLRPARRTIRLDGPGDGPDLAVAGDHSPLSISLRIERRDQERAWSEAIYSVSAVGLASGVSVAVAGSALLGSEPGALGETIASGQGGFGSVLGVLVALVAMFIVLGVVDVVTVGLLERRRVRLGVATRWRYAAGVVAGSGFAALLLALGPSWPFAVASVWLGAVAGLVIWRARRGRSAASS